MINFLERLQIDFKEHSFHERRILDPYTFISRSFLDIDNKQTAIYYVVQERNDSFDLRGDEADEELYERIKSDVEDYFTI